MKKWEHAAGTAIPTGNTTEVIDDVEASRADGSVLGASADDESRATAIAPVVNPSMDVASGIAPAIFPSSLEGAGGATARLVVSDTADHVINAVESTDVSFKVAGLGAGASGTATFADAAGHQVAVHVAADGSFSVDLSTLTDGTITSSLSVTDSAGHTATAAGNSVLLDTDRDLNPTISVNAANPTAVTFTVAGLEGDETGTMTFTDTSGHQSVVNVGSNGTYTTDLSSLTKGTLTYLLSVTDPAGNVTAVDPVATLGDGSANASPGSPQAANLLNGYAARPPWMVAGVDYAVGVPSGEALKSPLTLTTATGAINGVSLDTVNHLVRVDGSNVTLDGYDFTGWDVYVTGGAQNVTIKNSYFLHATVLADTTTSNISVLHCTLDGTGATDPSSSLITLNGVGSHTVQYCWLENSPQHFLELGGAGGTVNYSFNFVENGGTANGQHLNFIQFGGDNYTNPIISYNTMYQTFQPSQGEMIQIDGAFATGVTVSNALVTNNTMIAAPGPGAGGQSVSYMIHTDNLTTTGTVQNNYMVDANGGAFGFIYPIAPINAGKVTFSNNIDMATGKTILSDNSEVSSNVPPAAPVIASFSTGTSVLTGSAEAHSTVKVFDGTTLLGTVTADASGAWSYSNAALAVGSHSLTATATNTAGNTGVASLTGVVDNAAHVATTLDGLQSLATAGKLSWITLTDSTTPMLTISAAVSANDGLALSKITGAHDVNVTGISGQSYTALESDFDATGHVTLQKVTGITGQPYTAIENDYNATAQVTAQKFSGVTGQWFSAVENDYNAAGQVTAQKFSGVTGQWYSAVENDYDPTLHITAQKFFGVTGQSFTAVENDYNAAGQLTAQKAMGVTGQTYNAVQNDYTAGGQLIDQNYSNNDGSHAIVVQAATAALTASASSDTFVFNITPTTAGNVAIANFDVAHDSLQLSHTVLQSFADAMNHATQAGADVVITAGTETITLSNINKTSLSAGDFHFV